MSSLPFFLQATFDLLPLCEEFLLWGITGEALRREDDAPTLADLKTLVLPGLEALGVRARLCPLPEDESEFRRRVAERLRHGVRVPLIEVSLPKETGNFDEDAEFDPADEARIVGGRLLDTVPSSGAEFATEALLLVLTRAAIKGRQSANRDAVLLRWLAWALAYPERILTQNEIDSFRREQGAAFLAYLAGKQHTAFHNHLRRSSGVFRNGVIENAFEELRTAILPRSNLPAPMLLPLMETHRNLIATERRELIYLARAGTLLLKILAVCRLKSQCDHPEVRSLLRQLRSDPHLWVRDAARISP
jgi:hypothetical protein